MEVMASLNIPWEDLYHWASFLPYLELFKEQIQNLVSPGHGQWSQSPIMIHDVLSEGNLSKILKTIPIEISHNPGVMEHVLIDV
jgi:hypothetical protein